MHGNGLRSVNMKAIVSMRGKKVVSTKCKTQKCRLLFFCKWHSFDPL